MKAKNVVWTHYLLYILTTGTLQNLIFWHFEATKMQVIFWHSSDAARGLQNAAPEAEKWRDWGLPGSPRVPKGLPVPPKMLLKIVQKSAPSPGLPLRVLPRCLGYPPRPQNTVILVDQLSQAAARDNRFRECRFSKFLQINCPKPLPHFLALMSSILRARRSGRMPTWIYMEYIRNEQLIYP